MKTKKMNKRLVLNKATVINLDNMEQQNALGGGDDTVKPCRTIDFCPTQVGPVCEPTTLLPREPYTTDDYNACGDTKFSYCPTNCVC